ncbi:P-II family nitrogen regulator [Piscinibacter koreensis]|uniref:P-II family nitrogen regulator n=1 Tax=Piscinibacter koreensis TaxID=2742824 RepID=A0A7Y6TZ98_9BURK|nr:P-II family nitrogen regulator [Schlegelella koreensis]NUZ09078.1 P-II family nitrogen regulator [Schlegelella koreensis]
MKEIKAYVHASRVADVISAIKDCAAWGADRRGHRHNLAVYVVRGSLLASDSGEMHYSMDLGDEMINEYKIELICEDGEVDDIVRDLVAAGRTGQDVAGWVTVSDLTTAVPIRRA